MDRNAEIPDLLRVIAKNGSALRLVSIYRGLPIIYDATVTAIGANTVQIQCNKYQLACLYMVHETYLVGDQITGTIHADVTGLIPARDEAILANLSYVDRPYILREQIRVEPQEPLLISVQLKGSISTVEAQLADISLGGMGTYLDRNLFISKLFQVGVELTIIIPMPETMHVKAAPAQALPQTSDLSTRFSRETLRGMGFLNDENTPTRRATPTPTAPSNLSKISVQGQLVNLRPELLYGRYRLGIRLLQADKARFIISQFISQRQTEIIREFKTIYDSLARNEKAKT
jgi:hypothetical protein